LHELGHNAWDTVPVSFNVAILDQDVFSLNVTKVSQSTLKSSGERPWIVGIASSRHETYTRNFPRLLCVGGIGHS
jgi:hypothetical protein